MSTGNVPSEPTSHLCPQCGHPRQAMWHFCPMCARELEPIPHPCLPDLPMLGRCPDADIQELLRRVERPDLVWALADPAWEPFKARILANLSEGARRMLEDELSYLRPDHVAMLAAQTRIRCLAPELHEVGVISLRRGDEIWVTPENVGDFADPELEVAVAALDEEGIQHVLRAVDKKTLTFALVGSSLTTRQAFYDQMTNRAVALIEEEIGEMMTAVALPDLKAARVELWKLIRAIQGDF